MAKGKQQEPEEVVVEELDQPTPEPIEPDDSAGVLEPVRREEYDSAIQSLRNEISELKSVVADLEQVVTAPKGAVEFTTVFRGPDEEPGGSPSYVEDDVPEYVPGVQRSFDGGDSTEWYRGR